MIVFINHQSRTFDMTRTSVQMRRQALLLLLLMILLPLLDFCHIPCTQAIPIPQSKSSPPPTRRPKRRGTFRDFLRGIGAQAKAVLTGTLNAVTHPVTTLRGIGAFIAHPATSISNFRTAMASKSSGESESYDLGLKTGMGVTILAGLAGGGAALSAVSAMGTANTVHQVAQAGYQSAKAPPSPTYTMVKSSPFAPISSRDTDDGSDAFRSASFQAAWTRAKSIVLTPSAQGKMDESDSSYEAI